MRSFAVVIGFSVFALDLVSKWWVKSTQSELPYTVIENFFTIQVVRNQGIAFGLFHSMESDWKPPVLSIIAILAISIVIYQIIKTPGDQRLSLFALGLIMGGILGNFIDRLMHHYVVDFLTLHWKDQFAWPTFNIADSAITIGVFVILLQTVFSMKSEKSAAVFLLFSAGFTVQASSPDQLIDNLQRKYEEIQSFSAEFEQTLVNRGLEQRERGIVKMKKPGRMYWEYREPKEKYFVADGKKIYFYVPEENQLFVSRLDLNESNSPLLFLLGRGDIRRDFLVEVKGNTGSGGEPILLRLIPRKPQPDFSELLLLVSPSTYLIQKLTVVEPIGQQNEYELKNLKPNAPISDRQFKLKVPSHVEIIED